MDHRPRTRVEEPSSPNLIPMIDIMFLLLLFFLLGADMVARETEELDLCVAPHLVELEPERPDVPETIVNIHHAADATPCSAWATLGRCPTDAHWLRSISRVVYDAPGLRARLASLAESDRPQDAGFVVRRRVQIRADQGAPYGAVREVLRSCGASGITELALIGVLPGQERGPRAAGRRAGGPENGPGALSSGR